eukprot:6978774-Prymnesium_polylepis.1
MAGHGPGRSSRPATVDMPRCYHFVLMSVGPTATATQHWGLLTAHSPVCDCVSRAELRLRLRFNSTPTALP